MKKSNFCFKKSGLVLAVLMAGLAPCVYASDVKLSGFLSVGGGVVDDETKLSYNGISEEDFTIKNNIFGLQVTGTISDKLTATGQFIARSGNNYQVNSEWAYLTYNVSDSSKIRAGRLRTPFYMYSDFLDVGYAYSWISPPREVYYLPFNNIDGVDFYTSASLGSFDTTFQAYFGSFDDELELGGSPAKANTRNQMGVAGTFGKDWWNLRAAYHRADLTIESTSLTTLATTLRQFNFAANADKVLMDDDSVNFVEIGGTIDTGTFVAAAEHIELDATDSFLGKNIREYVMLGVRSGEFLYHITASKSDDELSHPEAGIPAGVALPVVGSTNYLIGVLKGAAAQESVHRDVLTLGVRWDVTSGTALKFQFDDVDDDAEGKQKVLSVAVQTVF
jgi:hypothetical protein